MDWRRLERWAIIATTAAYLAAAISLVIFLGEILLPEGTPAQRVFHGIANYLGRLGDIGGGSIVAIILSVLMGGGIYVLFLKAIDKYHENRERRARERAEWEAASREQERAEIRDELQQRGYDLDEMLRSNGQHPHPDDDVE